MALKPSTDLTSPPLSDEGWDWLVAYAADPQPSAQHEDVMQRAMQVFMAVHHPR